MQVKHRLKNQVCIVEIAGNLTWEEQAAVKSYVEPFLIDESLQGILIDFTNVDVVSSIGLGLVMYFHKTLQHRQAGFAIYALNAENLDLFNMSQLDKVIPIFPTEKAALDSLL